MNNKTWYWHIHHDNLLESSTNIAERIAYIKNHKPSNEILPRLEKLRVARLPKSVLDHINHLDIPRYYDMPLATWKRILELHEEQCPDCSWTEETPWLTF